MVQAELRRKEERNGEHFWIALIDPKAEGMKSYSGAKAPGHSFWKKADRRKGKKTKPVSLIMFALIRREAAFMGVPPICEKARK